MECYIINPALSLLMKHLVIDQRQKAPNFSAFHWSPHGSLVSIGQHFVTTRVVHLPKRTDTSLITKSDQRASNHQLCSYARPAQPGPIRTRLCGPCIAAIAGYRPLLGYEENKKHNNWRETILKELGDYIRNTARFTSKVAENGTSK